MGVSVNGCWRKHSGGQLDKKYPDRLLMTDIRVIGQNNGWKAGNRVKCGARIILNFGISSFNLVYILAQNTEQTKIFKDKSYLNTLF